jgi:hypothetical protein
LPVKTVRLALTACSDADDVVGVARLLLRQARELYQSDPDPLRETRAGNPERAWAAAEAFEPSLRILWLLLAAWEFQDAGREREARITLDQLTRLSSPPLAGSDPMVHHFGDYRWVGEYAAYLLASVADLHPPAFRHVRALLDGNARVSLAQHLLRNGRHRDAVETLVAVETQPRRRDHLCFALYEKLLDAKDEAGARMAVGQISAPEMKAFALCQLLGARLKQSPHSLPPEFESARELIRKVPESESRVRLFFTLFWVLLGTGR